VFVSTHFPGFLNAPDIREQFFMRKKKGQTEIISAQDEKMLTDIFDAYMGANPRNPR